MRNVLAVIGSMLAAAALATADARWPQFRGPNGAGAADPQTPPTEFSGARNLLWKTPLPPGHSCPVVWDDRIFLTAHNRGKLETICINRTDGQILWRQTAPVQRIERVTSANSPATPTPVTDGKNVYVLFGSFGLLAYDCSGKELWRKPLPITNVRHGSAASPILAGNRLIVNGDQEGFKSFLIAVDPQTGQTLWQTPRPLCFSSHTTPVYWKRADHDEVVVAGSIRLVAYDADDGSERWSSKGLEAISICPSPIVAGDTVYAMSFSMPDRIPTFDDALKNDKNGDGKISAQETTGIVRDVHMILDSNGDRLVTREEWEANFRIFKEADNGLFAVRNPDSGDVTASHVAWKDKRGVTEVSSPLFYRGRIFIVRGGGFASCFNAADGTPLYLAKRIGADGQYYASPIAANGHIYVASTLGVVTVLKAADELHVVAHNDLGEAITATPAIADNKLYIRTSDHLYAIGQ